jgi:hypothetical protein
VCQFCGEVQAAENIVSEVPRDARYRDLDNLVEGVVKARCRTARVAGLPTETMSRLRRVLPQVWLVAHKQPAAAFQWAETLAWWPHLADLPVYRYHWLTWYRIWLDFCRTSHRCKTFPSAFTGALVSLFTSWDAVAPTFLLKLEAAGLIHLLDYYLLSAFFRQHPIFTVRKLLQAEWGYWLSRWQTELGLPEAFLSRVRARGPRKFLLRGDHAPRAMLDLIWTWVAIRGQIPGTECLADEELILGTAARIRPSHPLKTPNLYSYLRADILHLSKEARSRLLTRWTATRYLVKGVPPPARTAAHIRQWCPDWYPADTALLSVIPREED